MEITIAVLSISTAIALGAMSPGPSFIMVARTSLAGSRGDGIAAAFGMGTGAVLFAIAALLGLHAVLNTVPSLYIMVKVLGGACLLYFGYRIWRGANTPLSLAEGQCKTSGSNALRRSFFLGFATQVSNPKTAVVYASIFISLLPHELPVPLMIGLALLVFAIETGWYSIVALALSAPLHRATYLRFKPKLDRIAGGVLAVLGIKLVAGAHQP